MYHVKITKEFETQLLKLFMLMRDYGVDEETASGVGHFMDTKEQAEMPIQMLQKNPTNKRREILLMVQEIHQRIPFVNQ